MAVRAFSNKIAEKLQNGKITMLLKILFVSGVFPGINEQLHVGKTFLLMWLSGGLRNLY